MLRLLLLGLWGMLMQMQGAATESPTNECYTSSLLAKHFNISRGPLNSTTHALISVSRTDVYRPYEEYNLSLSVADDVPRFVFAIEPVGDKWRDPGSLTLSGGLVSHIGDCRNALTGTFPTDKIHFFWQAPPKGSGCQRHSLLILEYGEGRLIEVDPVISCEESPSCCAVRGATYKVEFQPILGNTSQWSDVIGITHNAHFDFWKGGMWDSFLQLAGNMSVPSLEQELNDMVIIPHDVEQCSHRNRGFGYPAVSCFKAPRPPHANAETLYSQFFVKGDSNAISLVSRFGPYPEWVVGVSGLSLCSSECSFVQNRTIDLYPEAGAYPNESLTVPSSQRQPLARLFITRLEDNTPSCPNENELGVTVKATSSGVTSACNVKEIVCKRFKNIEFHPGDGGNYLFVEEMSQDGNIIAYKPSMTYQIIVWARYYPFKHAVVAAELVGDKGQDAGSFKRGSEGVYVGNWDFANCRSGAFVRDVQDQSVRLLWTAPPEGSGPVRFRFKSNVPGLLELPCDAYLLSYEQNINTSLSKRKYFAEFFQTNKSELGKTKKCLKTGSMLTINPQKSIGFEFKHALLLEQFDFQTISGNTADWSNVTGAIHASNLDFWHYFRPILFYDGVVDEYSLQQALQQESLVLGGAMLSIVNVSGPLNSTSDKQSIGSTFFVHDYVSNISLVASIGPYPYRAVRVSGVGLCSSNCSLVEGKTIDLLPIRRAHLDEPVARLVLTRLELNGKSCPSNQDQDKKSKPGLEIINTAGTDERNGSYNVVWAVLLTTGVVIIIISVFYLLRSRRKKEVFKGRDERYEADAEEEEGDEGAEAEEGNKDNKLGIENLAYQLLPYDSKFEFPPEKLVLGDILGRGNFGIVWKAVAHGLGNRETTTTVAVKMVRNNLDSGAVNALKSELKIMIHLGCHLNVVNLLGACTKSPNPEELMVIVEYCPNGNLQDYLYKHRERFVDQIDPQTGFINCSIREDVVLPFPHSQNSCGYLDSRGECDSRVETPNDYESHSDAGAEEKQAVTSTVFTIQDNYWTVINHCYESDGGRNYVTTRDLLYFSFQIASGMKYLAARKVLHGDLAARNVLVAGNKTVKVSDFGLSKSLYKYSEYSRSENVPLPMKWMAVESIRHRIFSTQSDVWSFGIVLWELFTLAERPYPDMKCHATVLKALEAGYRLKKPPYATETMHDIMIQCWRADPTSRPSFTELADGLEQMLDETIRQMYVNMSKPYVQMNAKRREEADYEDYVDTLSPPTYTNMMSPTGVGDLKSGLSKTVPQKATGAIATSQTHRHDVPVPPDPEVDGEPIFEAHQSVEKAKNL